MKFQKKRLPFLGTALAICAIFLVLTACAPTFEGSATKNADAYAPENPTDGVYTTPAEGKGAQGNIPVDVEKGSEPEAAEPVTAEDLAGPWHLAAGENDDAAVNDVFPGAMEFGNAMEITGDGRISWYIGADGGTGTYTLDGNILSASMTNDFDGTAMTVELTAEDKSGHLLLTMEYKDVTLRWSWGEGETGKGESSDGS